MPDSTIRYYPVGNGDATLIKLVDGTTILVDANIREAEDEDGNETCYDVKGDLLELLRKERGVSHLDVFILTHPDQDHCRGFKRDFYVGDPANYSDTDKKEEKIVIDELWFAPRIFSPHEEDLCEDAQAIKDEAERRKAIHQKKESNRNDLGNRLRCIGYSYNAELNGLDEILVIPGERTRTIAGSKRNDIELFIFAPVQADTDAENGDRNDTSIAFAAEILNGTEVTNRLHFFGDNSCHVLERIYDRNKGQSQLEYDHSLAPHHCSWGTFNKDKDGEASEKVKDLFKSKRSGAMIVASSLPVDGEHNPPSEKAAKIYKDIVGQDKFYCTEEYPTEADPKPLVFTLTVKGPRREDPQGGNSNSASKLASISFTASTPKKYGLPKKYG